MQNSPLFRKPVESTGIEGSDQKKDIGIFCSGIRIVFDGRC